MVRLYLATGRLLLDANMRWDYVLLILYQQHNAIKEAAKKDPPDVPKLTNSTSVPKWVESMQIHATQVQCSRCGTLAYLTRQHVTVEVDVPDLVPGQPHSELRGSIEDDMTHRFSHIHAMYCNDCMKLFNFLEETTCGTKWANMIKPFPRKQDGVVRVGHF